MNPIQRWVHGRHGGNLARASCGDAPIWVGEDDILADAEEGGRAIHGDCLTLLPASPGRRQSGCITQVVNMGSIARGQGSCAFT